MTKLLPVFRLTADEVSLNTRITWPNSDQTEWYLVESVHTQLEVGFVSLQTVDQDGEDHTLVLHDWERVDQIDDSVAGLPPVPGVESISPSS